MESRTASASRTAVSLAWARRAPFTARAVRGGRDPRAPCRRARGAAARVRATGGAAMPCAVRARRRRRGATPSPRRRAPTCTLRKCLVRHAFAPAPRAGRDAAAANGTDASRRSWCVGPTYIVTVVCARLPFLLTPLLSASPSLPPHSLLLLRAARPGRSVRSGASPVARARAALRGEEQEPGDDALVPRPLR